MRLNVKSDEIRSQQSVHQLPLPGTDTEGFRVGPRDMPENSHARVRPVLLDHLWQQSEVVVLHQHYGLGDVLDLPEHRSGELAIHLLRVLPVLGPKDGARVRDWTTRPKTLLAEDVEGALLLH